MPESRAISVEILMTDEITDSSQTVAAGQLRAFIERIERLVVEKQSMADDIKDVYAEMKGTGFGSPLKLVA
jgi:uncharacterized protein (UPF0335 family)